MVSYYARPLYHTILPMLLDKTLSHTHISIHMFYTHRQTTVGHFSFHSFPSTLSHSLPLPSLWYDTTLSIVLYPSVHPFNPIHQPIHQLISPRTGWTVRTSLNNSQTAVDKKEKKQKGTKKKTQLIPAITSRQTDRQSKLEFKGKNGQNEQAKQKNP